MKVAYVLSTCAKLGPFIVARDIINNIHLRVDPIDVYYLKESDEKLNFHARLIKTSFFAKTDFSNYDIIHSHGFLADFYVFNNRKKILGKWITTMHQKIKPDYSMTYNRLVGYLLEKLWCHFVEASNCIVTLTNEMADYYKGVIKGTTITFIYNGISPRTNDFSVLSEENQILSLKSKYILIGISANLIYRKGIDQVVKALALPQAYNLALLVIGSGKDGPGLRTLARTLGVADRCIFIGFKSNAIDYFRYFDIYMMSSRSEGFGLCVIEAASQRIPVVCNDLPVYRELFSSNEIERFDLANPSSLVNAVNKAVKDRMKLSEAIHQVYKRNFTAEVMVEKYLKLYKDVAG